MRREDEDVLGVDVGEFAHELLVGKADGCVCAFDVRDSQWS